MNTSERLQALGSTLQQQGVVDVKFYFERGSLSTLPSSEVAEKVADFLDCYLSDSSVQVDGIAQELN